MTTPSCTTYQYSINDFRVNGEGGEEVEEIGVETGAPVQWCTGPSWVISHFHPVVSDRGVGADIGEWEYISL